MRDLRPVLALGLVLGAALAVPQAGAADRPVDSRVEITMAVHSDVSPALRDIATPFRVTPGRIVPELGNRSLEVGAPLPDPVQQTSVPTPPRAALVHAYDGLGDGFPGFSVNAIPPDTVGAVGRTQYVQWVNSGFVVLDKETGKPVLGPSNGNAIWKGFGGECEKENDGDPVVNYDRFADRWVLQQFAVTNGNYECLAVSRTPDATGAYNRYAFQYVGFNDYPKAGVWSHSYVQTYNMFDAESGTKVCALERAAMLAGLPARQACIQLPAGAPALLPADADGTLPPGPSEDAPLLGLGGNSLQLYDLHVDWAKPTKTALSAARTLPVAAYSPACGVLYATASRTTGACVPQPLTGLAGQVSMLGLDPLSDRPMFRLAWRRFADGHDAMAVTHSVDALPAAAAALRWYELRRTSDTPWAVQQQGTYLPDLDSRWMGSVAMDRNGGLAIGYSVSGATLTFPGVRIAGRTADDPAGTLSQETIVATGAGEQATAGYIARWGDYSAMSVDPVDDCTLWYTTEYMLTTGIFNWNTKIAAVRLPGC